MRHALAVLALVIVWALVLGDAAGIPWAAPWSPLRSVTLRGADFRPVIGAAIDDGEALGVGATARDGNALQTVTLERTDAGETPILSYRFEDFPRTLELSLVFRRADAPNDVQAILLPWPGDGVRTVDLSTLPAWRGGIVELGFAEYATAQLVSPSIAFKPFRLARARLASRSWSALPGLLRTAWLGYQPWNLTSINALGPSINALQTPSLLPPLVAVAVLSVLVLVWLWRWPRARALWTGVVAVAIAWVALDLRWLDDLGAKHRLTDSIYAGKPWPERARLQPDEDIAGFAQLVRQQLGGIPTHQRILVAADSTYTLLRLIYFLLPLNAAPLESASGAVPPAQWPDGTVIVLCANSRWRFDEASSTLRAETRAIKVAPLFSGGNLNIYSTRRAAR